jgi:leucyl-tRNA synthetase
MKPYDPSKIEKKWQIFWEKSGIFKGKEKKGGKKFYCLDMFPYPSAYGLHVGHLKGYAISDVIAKKKMMQGFNCLHPMGFDAFGLPAENYAIKTGVHPAIQTEKAIRNIREQLKKSGFGYDWEREVITFDPDYYKWTQWMFLTLFKAGLAYQKKAPVNYCPSCKTVLAREQVIDEKCERCGSPVEKKYLKQWFFKITDFADRLLEDLGKIDWPEKIKIMQENWIGKSEGAEIIFEIKLQNSRDNLPLPVFTTRIDTLFGCTYVVLSPEHQIIERIGENIENREEVESYIKASKKKTEIERVSEKKEKTGKELKGIVAVNPVNNKEIPVFVADYVLMDYGTGAIMAVPSHDQRDLAFAKKYGLPIKKVISPIDQKEKDLFEGEGVLINSGPFSGLSSKKAEEEIIKYLSLRKLAKKTVYFRLRDWLISRQRYWGAPIPVIHCQKCGSVPVPEKDLPVKLPNIKDFKPAGEGKSPLAKSKKFVEVKCPVCGGKAERETDTMDTFVCSSWYFLRYTDSKNKKAFASKKQLEKWLPVDLYVGGAEHACLHLLYSRFFVKALKDLGYLSFEEPFSNLFCQGTVYYQGAKMSKSKGNVITPDVLIKKYGADTMRLYELFMGPADQATEWSDKGVKGCHRFLNKVWSLQEKTSREEKNGNLEKLVHQTVKKVTEDIDSFRFNTAVSSLMILANEMEKEKSVPLESYKTMVKLASPMVPHISEEIWSRLGGKKSIFFEKWPEYNRSFIKKETFELIIQVNGKVRDRMEVKSGTTEEKIRELTLRREKVKKWIERKEIKRIIFVPGKLINLVIS